MGNKTFSSSILWNLATGTSIESQADICKHDIDKLEALENGAQFFHSQLFSHSLSFVAFNSSFLFFAQSLFLMFSLLRVVPRQNVIQLFSSASICLCSYLRSAHLVILASGCLSSGDPPELCILQHKSMPEILIDLLKVTHAKSYSCKDPSS